MVPRRIMIIAGETSSDLLAAELVRELRARLERRPTYSDDLQPLRADLAPIFFGAGGPRMADAGVELAFDLTSHAVVGLWEVLVNYFKFKRFFDELLRMARERQPDAIICVDFQEFNRRFAHALKQYLRSRRGPFFDWHPKLIQYVSPQLWASREGRARQLVRDLDLLLSIVPFEKNWYAARFPNFPVTFVGHPVVDRYQSAPNAQSPAASPAAPLIALLPGSRKAELTRHLPVMLEAFRAIQSALPSCTAVIVLPSDELARMARAIAPANMEVRVGALAETLRSARLAIASTGTVTMECALYGVPTVTLYKTSAFTWQVGKRFATVKWLTLPNILVNQPVFPEFLQHDATPANISRAALELLGDEPRRQSVKAQLAEIVGSLGGPGAPKRAAEAIAALIETPSAP